MHMQTIDEKIRHPLLRTEDLRRWRKNKVGKHGTKKAKTLRSHRGGRS